MSTRERSGPRPSHRPGHRDNTETISTAKRDQRQHIGSGGPAVAAEAYPPAGRRRTWLLLIKSCPFCGYAHVHRGSADGGERVASCGRGAYRLQARPAERVAA